MAQTAGKSDDAVAIEPLRKLLKELQPIVFGEDDDEDEEEVGLAALKHLLFELKVASSSKPTWGY
jgi:hypothetical protein